MCVVCSAALRPEGGQPCARRVPGGPRAQSRSGKRPCSPWSDKQSLSLWVTRNSDGGAVSTGPGLGPSLPTCSRAPWLPRREKQGEGSRLLLPWNLSHSGVEQLPEALAGLRLHSRAALLSQSDPVRCLCPWPSITLHGPFAPCWAGLIACAPREVARVSQATLKACSLYQFLIHGLCSGGRDITLQKVLSAKRGRASLCAERPGQQAFRCSLIQVSVCCTRSVPFSALLPTLWLCSRGVYGPGGRLGSGLRAGERNPVLSLLKAPESHTGFTDCHWLTLYYELTCAPSERYVETLAQYLQI